MEIIDAKLSSNYKIFINSDFPENNCENESLGDFIKSNFEACKILIITDENLEKLHLDKLKNHFKYQNFTLFQYTVKACEESKSFSELQKITAFLADNNFSRSDLLLAFGGGVICDLTGFCASIYMRGISYIQIPTGILAAIDASVGGKTAINIEQGKNLIGSFYQPSAVFCYTGFFQTLKEEEFLNAYGELVKYAMLSYKMPLDLILKYKKKYLESDFKESLDLNFLNQIICRSVKIKLEFIENDEHDLAKRQLLNLGHTIGHAVEKLSGYSYPHGKAVAFGILVIAEISAALGFLSTSCEKAIKNSLDVFKFNDMDLSLSAICDAIKSDKKQRDESINFVMLKSIGEAFIKPIKFKEMEEFLCLSKYFRKN